MRLARPDRSGDRRRRWTLAFAYAVLLTSCDSPFAPDVQQVGRLEVNPPVLTMVVGGEATLVARVFDESENLLPTAKVFWSTQDPTVVSINQAGAVTAVGAGTAQLAASSGGMSRTIAVTVAPRPIALIRISPPATNVIAGQTVALQGEAIDGTGNVLTGRVLEWTSSAPAVATVDASGVVTGVAIGQTTISAAGEGKVGTSIVTVVPAPVVTITVTPNGGSLPAGATLALTATPRDANGTALVGRTLQWRSSNDAIATVSAAGLLTAISPGTVTITVSAPDGGPNGSTPSTSVTVTVLIEPVANATIVPSPIGIQVSSTFSLTLNLFNSAGEPLSTAGRTIGWTSNNSSVASVNSAGVVTGVSVGTAIVTATVTTPGQAQPVLATTQVNVSNRPVASVVVTPSPATVHAGYTRRFTAVALDDAGQPLPGRVIIFTSSSQAIASVDATAGLVTGLIPGAVQIRATSEGVQGFADVIVDLVPVRTVTVTPSSAVLLPTQTRQLSAVPRDSAGTALVGNALGNRTTTWSSANTAAATVSIGGLVTAVAPGAADISATIGGTAGIANITVNALPSASQLSLTTPPSGTVQNDVVFPVQPSVQLKDASGNNVLTAGVNITAAIAAPGTGTLGGTTTAVTDANGLATFSGLRITGLVGPRTLTFSSGALTPASAGVTVQPGVATQLAMVTGPPSTANSGQVFSTATVLQLRDVSGNDVLTNGVLVSASVTPSAGVTLGGATTTTTGGTATFGALTITGPAATYTLTFTSGALPPVSSGGVTLGAGSGSKLSITTQPSATAQNGQVFPVQPVIQLLDGSNNPVAQAGVQVSAAILSGGGSLGGTTVATTGPTGQASFTNLSITGTVGSRTLLFGASGFTAVTSSGINITAGSPTALSIVTQPSANAQSGVAFGAQPAVQLVDASGNAVPQAGVTVTATLIGAGGAFIGSASAATSGAGLATFSGLGIAGTVGTYSIAFGATGLTGASSSAINLSAGAASQLTITTAPAGAVSGTAFTTQPAIRVRDAQGNPVLQAGTIVSASITSGGPGALIGATTASTDASGLAVFSGLGISGTVGAYTLGFGSGSLTGATSGITLAHGAPAQLVIVTQPGGAAAGAPFTTQPVLQVRDAQGNPVTVAGSAVNASIASGPGGSLIGGSASTDGTGTATFSGLGISGPVGAYTLGFSSGSLTATSGSINLTAGPPAQLTIATQPSSTVASGSVLAQQPAVQVRDAGGNPVPQAAISVSAVLVPGGASLTGTATVTTDGTGLATFSGLGISGLVGNYSIAFSSGALTGASSGGISVTPGPAAQLTVVTQPGGAASGAAFTTQPAVQVRDAQGNAVTASVNVTAAVGSGPGATLSGTTTVATNGSGLAAFSGLALSGPVGNYTLAFSAPSLTGVSSGAFTLAPGAPAELVIQTQPSGAVNGSAFTTQPQVLVRDAQANAVGAGVSVSTSIASGPGGSLTGTTSALTASNGVASFSGLGLSGLVGNYTLNFSASGAPTVTSGAFALAAGPAVQLAITAQPPSSAVNGSTLSSSPTVELRDAGGNTVTTSGVTVTVSLVGSGAALSGTTSTATTNGVASFPGLVITGTVGSYSLSFASSGLTGATSSGIALTAGAPTQLTITTQPPGASGGGTFTPSPAVRLRDASGNAAAVAGIQVGATLNIISGAASLTGGTSAATDGTGVATFSGMGISNDNGTYSITFSGTGLTSATSSTIVVTLPPTQLAVIAEPSPNATNGVAFAAQPSVQLRDVNGTAVTLSGVAVTATLNGAGGTLFGTATVNTVNGVATFTGLGINGLVGNYSLSFGSGSLTGASSAGIALGAGAATQLTFVTPPPGSATDNVAFGTQPVLQLRDAQGNPVPTAGVTVTAARASGPASATVFGATATTDGSGTASFTGLGINGPANNVYTLSFSAPGVTSVTSGAIALNPFEFAEAFRSNTRAGSDTPERVVKVGEGQPLITFGWSAPTFAGEGGTGRPNANTSVMQMTISWAGKPNSGPRQADTAVNLRHELDRALL